MLFSHLLPVPLMSPKDKKCDRLMLKASKIYTRSHSKQLTKPVFAKNKPAFDALRPGVCCKLLARHVSLHQFVHLSEQARPHLPPAQVGDVQQLHVSF